MNRAELLSKLISQELDLMTTKDVSPQAAKDRIDQLCAHISTARTKFNELRTRNTPSSSSSSAIASGKGDQNCDLELERDLQLLNKEVSVLKSMFPFCLFKKPNTTDPNINWRDRSTPHFVSAAPDKLMHNLITDDNFNRAPVYPELKVSLQGINNYMRRILACFLVFPQNAIIKKSLLVRWVEVHAAGDRGTQLIHDLIAKGLIHPVYKDTLTVGGYWMHSFVRSMLSHHNLLKVSDHQDKVYMTDNSSEDIFYDDPTPFLTAEKRELSILHLGNWQRSSVRHIEVEHPNSFFKDMSNLSDLRYVSLRGVSLVTEMPQFITMLKVLQTLDLKSCHNLEVIPSSVGNLASSLTHLDMSECYFLEGMPMALSSLSNLRVLKGFVVPGDIKDNSCTLPDLLSLQKLVKLNIYTSLKSFPNSYEQQTLTEFSSLRSLTISWGGCSLTGNYGVIATAREIKHLQRYEKKRPTTTCIGRLKRLLVGTDSQSALLSHVDSMDLYGKKSHVPASFDRLDKLDLQCVPQTITQDWLNPANFRNLKKLYIRGGRFSDLGQKKVELIEEKERERFIDRWRQVEQRMLEDISGPREEDGVHIKVDRIRSYPEVLLPGGDDMKDYQWSVEVLRLKHLENLEMDYRVLVRLFPNLICLENVKCPNLKNFPCNDSVWKDTTKSPPTNYI